MATMTECRKTIVKLFKARFSALEQSELAWVSYLDPRVAKRMAHLRNESKARAQNDIVRATVEITKEEEQLRGTDSARELLLSPVPTPVEIEDFMDDLIFGFDDVNVSTADLERACGEDFRSYLRGVDKVKKSDDPFLWWKLNDLSYPHLAKLARKWLGAVATSVSPERAFSASGNTVPVKRCSLTPDIVRDLLFVSENWRVESI
jgi:hypothetical protein